MKIVTKNNLIKLEELKRQYESYDFDKETKKYLI